MGDQSGIDTRNRPRHRALWGTLAGLVAFVGAFGLAWSFAGDTVKNTACSAVKLWCTDFDSPETALDMRVFFGSAGGSTPANAWALTSQAYQSGHTRQSFVDGFGPDYWAEVTGIEPVPKQRNTFTVHVTEFRGPIAGGSVQLLNRDYTVELSREGSRVVYDILSRVTVPGTTRSPVSLVTWNRRTETYSDPTLDSHEQLAAENGPAGHRENGLCELRRQQVEGSDWWTRTIVAWIPNAYLTVSGRQIRTLPLCHQLVEDTS